MNLSHPARAGDLVVVRRQRWRVVDARAFDACRLLTLAGAGRANWRVSRSLIEPFDDVEPADGTGRVRRTGIRRWRHACRDLLASNVEPGGLRSARDARIDLLAHQLEPAVAIVRGAGSRVLLADEVGLGKTIQAGLIVSELRGRGCADRVLVLTPAGLRDQWRLELHARFGIDAAVLDAHTVRRRVADLPAGENPWATLPVVIASVDYAKRPEVLPALLACRWDLLVIDEAHTAAGRSDRYDAVARIGARVPWLVLATATPHNGDARAFASLCDIGNLGDRLLVFRRTRADIRIGVARRVHRLDVRLTRDELRVHRVLDRLAAAAARERGDREGVRLALGVLRSRALSGAWALAESVERRLHVLDRRPGRSAQFALPFDPDEGDEDPADAPPEWPEPLALSDEAHERALLNDLASSARRADAHDSKLAALRRLLRRAREPVIVFTAFRDTLLHVRDAVAPGAALLHGGLSRRQRLDALEAFGSGRCRVLLATDAAGEGLNLQAACRTVVNLELPWNPMRLEQRIGRVDRLGQKRVVHAFHLVARHASERRVFLRLARRIAGIDADIGAPDPLGTAMASRKTAAHRERDTIDWPDLRADAVREAQRIVAARILVPPTREDAPVVPVADTLVARARRVSTRAWLHGARLLIVHLAAHDGCGQPVASTVVPLLVRSHTDPDVELEAAAAAASGWFARVRAGQDAFCLQRARRADALLARCAHRDDTSYQSGLFDQRAETEHALADASARDDIQDAAARLDAIREQTTLTLSRPQLRLVLEP